ncbi:MAG: proprotein convertase P-domain-containing protein [Deltaproteobacteria bacterium]|nr:proprotein convertase P-domain-containing protein [Deltaproteobacteria bacterium]
MVGILAAGAAQAAVPMLTNLEGVLLSGSGTAAPDGKYDVTLQLYGQEVGGTAAWKEGPLAVTVKNGQFSLALGAATPLSAQLLGSLSQVWLGVTVGPDPELPRKQLQSVPFSLRAALAEGLDCSGCVGLSHLDSKVLAGYAKTTDLAAYAKAADLSGYAQKADLADYVKAAALAKVAGTGAYADLIGAPKLADVATTGNYGDLKGAPVLAKIGTSCGTGLVMKGIKADGSYECVAATTTISAADLPPDGLSKVSNGLLTDQFTEVAASAAVPIPIPDFLGAGVSDSINVPDFGVAQGMAVAVTLTNSDVSKIRIDLYDPAGTKTTIYNGEKTGTTLSLLYASPSKGLDTYVGQNPKGLWSITVADLGNNSLKTDGQITSWQVQVKTLSSKKVAANGGFQFFVSPTAPTPCNPANFGMSYANSKDKALYICNGTDWAAVYLTIPGSKENPVVSCKDLQTKVPLAKDGPYWINPDNTTAYQVWCDMTTDGGGWTLVMRFKNDNKLGFASAFWTDKNVFNEDGSGAVDPTLNLNAKLGSFVNMPGATIRGCKGVPGGGQCVQQSLLGTKTLNTVFNEGFKNGGPGRGTLVGFWGDDGSQPYCNGSGINNTSANYGGYGTYSGARFGLVGNNENDCATTDSGWGFGTYGCSDTGKSCGAGANFWQSGSCGGNCTHGTLWVR